ncbi:MAG TPA: Ig-like domain-containing protein [Candidatus Polarisedimenticolia bacterium]|nr:Ig-like domain-containing protein [Candidatus Polarisedimenticolia bacterium]
MSRPRLTPAPKAPGSQARRPRGAAPPSAARFVAVALMLAAALALLPGPAAPARAGELSIGDGVVIKFGPGGELVVLDGVIVQGQAVCTSLGDDARGGAALSTPALPLPGDWRGLRLERSSPAAMTQLDGLQVLYGGAGPGSAFLLRSTQIPLGGFEVSQSGGVGLEAASGTTSPLRNLILTGNQVGLQVDEGARVSVESSVISGNASYGARSLDPAVSTPASGVWWGHPSGPLDASDDRAGGGLFNPDGLGNQVSDRIAYTPVAGAIPLFGLSLTPFGGGVASQPAISFLLRAPTAVAVRLSEDATFAGVPFQPLTPARPFVLSSPDGLKTIYAEFQAATGNTAVTSTQVRLDTAGPTLAVNNPSPGAVLSRPLTVVASASDASGVARVEFYVDGRLLATDTTNTFSFDWDVRTAGDGPHVLGVVAVDNVGKATRQEVTVAVAAAPPSPPVITSPAGGTLTAAAAIAVAGSAEPGVNVTLYDNTSIVGRAVADPTGSWGFGTVPITEGLNALTAIASDRIGSSPPSVSVAVTRDNGAPPPPTFFTVQDLGGGTFRFDWLPADAPDVGSYTLYRAGAAFTTRTQATPIASGLTTLFTRDVPPGEGSFFYAVTARDVTGNESLISSLVQVSVDRTAPSAAVSAAPAGTVGPGPVTLTILTSENIPGEPFLSVTPQGGTPTGVTLAPTGAPRTWSGLFNVLAGMPSGPATLAFSARDAAGNRGTLITSGGTLNLDTRGPAGSVAVTPARVLGPGSYALRLTLDEPAAGTPALRFLPPVGAPVVLALSGGGAVWDGSLVVDSSMGDGPGRFDLTATDLFGNTASGIVPGAGVDLDNTPPDPPAGLAATVLPAGQVRLNWTASPGATYNLYRVPSGQPFVPGQPALAGGLASPSYTDLPPVDGDYVYAVSALDAVGNESARSAPAAATSDRIPPGDPSGLTLAIEGNGLRAAWTPAAVNPAGTFVLFRATSPITTLAGLTPVQVGLTSPTAFDRPPADGIYHYAVAGRDAAGNQSNFAAAGPITFDQAGPVITVSGVSDGQATRGPVTITFSASDFSLQSLRATLDGDPFISGASVAAEGDHLLVVNAADASGNASTTTIAFAVDDTPPVVTVTGISDGAHVGAAVTPVVTITEARPRQSGITLNGSPFSSGTSITADGSYVLAVRAEDRAGNVTSLTLGFVIDAPPRGVVSLNLDLPQDGFPVLTWVAPPDPDLVGFLVSRNGSRLTPSPITGTTFTDGGFDTFSTQVYGVVAVDAAGNRSAETFVTLPIVTCGLGSYGSGQKLTRRYLDTIGVTIDNHDPSPVGPVSVEMTLKDGATVLGTRTRTPSDPFAPGASTTLADVFSTGPGTAATRTLEVAATLSSGPGTRVRVLKSFALDVREPGRAIEVFNDPIVLGGQARITLRLLNQGSARLQVRTSQSNGPSPDVEVFVKDLDGNVLGSGRLDQRSSGVIVTGSLAFADIGVGSGFLSRPVEVQIPSNAPHDVVVEAVVHVTHSNLVGAGDVTGPELSGQASAVTGNPPYLAVAASDRSVYDQGEPVSITGRAFDPGTGAPVPNVPVKIGINTRGFDRFLFATSDTAGQFAATFTPLASEAGAYNLWATHPVVTERASQAAFSILGLALSPAAFNLRMSQNSSFPIDLTLKNTGESALTGFGFDVTGGHGISGEVDATALGGLLDPGQSARVRLTVTAAADADLANFATLRITDAEGATRTFDVSIALVPAVPAIQAEPNFVEVGQGNGTLVTKTVRIRNLGFAPLEGITLDPPTTPWMTLGVGPDLPAIPVGGFTDVPVVFAPDAAVTPGIYSDRFIVRGSNHVPYTENLFAVVTASQTGTAAFEVRNTENVLLDGASVWIQNLQVPTLTISRATDATGHVTFADLPAGPYQYRVQATGTEPTNGKFDVQPDQVTPLSVFMNVVYVSFEWSVTPVVLQDRYDFKLTATFETAVPAPVLVADPSRFDLILEPGATYIGEYTLTNHGLVAADDVQIAPTASPGLILETLVSGVPRLGAMQSITVPFRLTRLGSLPAGLAGGASFASSARGPAADGGGVTPQNDVDLCQPVTALVSNSGSYTCAAGFTTGATTPVSYTVGSQIAQDLGLCDDECSLCGCIGLINGTAGAICECLSKAASGSASAIDKGCACLGAVPGVGTAANIACNCLPLSGEVNQLDCLSSIPIIGDVIDILKKPWDAVKCGISLAKCVCKYAPSICTPGSGGGGTTGGGGGCCGLPNWGGYGGGYPPVSVPSLCN